ncbi:MAG: hypothetical protein CFE34_19485 [Rhodobacteraceae bacterium PARR1]|nr:MAG: hypothetical protein CFE34_19485 [Rhodobacteraceae bacterium PARR1]
MDWRGRRGSSNIEDRRRISGGRGAGVGGVGVLAIVVIGYFLGVDLTPLLEGGQGVTPQTQTRELTAEDQAMGEFVSVPLADTEQVWAQVFDQQLGAIYTPATLVLFKDATTSPCGGASQATGPFYCPTDRKVYLDTGFFVTLDRQLGAGGDFAAAYVVAHEIGHHVQNELGLLEKTNRARASAGEAEANAISVRVELMADCFAGVWAHHAARQLGTIERGDVAEAMNAAARIGDDTLQREAGRTPMPDSFTHGSSDQRMRWFETGQKTGQVARCDTFAARKL